jgi:predicted nucleic acid-binding protein
MGHMRVVLFEATDVARAIEIHSREQVSPWDALVIHAALKGGCETLYTEDLQDGRKFGALTVVNPFRQV